MNCYGVLAIVAKSMLRRRHCPSSLIYIATDRR